MKKLISLFIALVMIAALATAPACAERYTLQNYSIEVPAGWTSGVQDNILYLYGPNGVESGYVMLMVQDFSDYASVVSDPEAAQGIYSIVISGILQTTGGSTLTEEPATVAGLYGRSFTTNMYGMTVLGWVAINGNDLAAVMVCNVDDAQGMLNTFSVN